ncbi:hypothetical protein GCM10025768_07730 [Microbacterium pseudoresistens]|uniref:TRAP-type C4-dicarboxylate transport system permease small subunit n=1 Tax=Microbacterium pseudoresistens TaxID=640634 RepID=A0A7Y9EVJ3_9MICO|nr:TRAP transporter small permease subunit [Microbacterium pseudoresistens]NYD54611.1 TRAP-type C4-dicarboxylate transport system permease small subunit [Microbacterium pseudoresistens]
MTPTATPVWRRAETAALFLDRALLVIAGSAMVLVTATIALGTVTRYFFNTALPGTHEIIETYGLPLVVMLGMGYTFRAGGHVRITLLTRALPQRWQRGFAYVAGVASLIVAIALTWGSAARAAREYANGSASAGLMALPLWIGYVVVALGLLSLCLLVFLDLFKVPANSSQFTSTEEDLDAGI